MHVKKMGCISGLAVALGFTAVTLTTGDVGVALAEPTPSPSADARSPDGSDPTPRPRGTRGHTAPRAAAAKSDGPRARRATKPPSGLLDPPRLSPDLTPAAVVKPENTIAPAVSTPTPTATAATPAPASPPLQVAKATGSVTSAPSSLAGSGPGAPTESPVSWVVLSAVRRWGRPQSGSTVATPVSQSPMATPVSQSQMTAPPVASSVLNRPPVIGGIAVGTPNVSTGAVTGTVTAYDPNRDSITYRTTTSTKGTVSVTTTGVFSYVPTAIARHAAAKIGAGTSLTTDLVTVTVTDSRGARTSAIATVPISPKNAVPVATLTVGAPNAATGVVTGAVTATDADRDTLTYSGSTTTAKGAVTVSATGRFSYTPTAAGRHNAAATGATNADTHDVVTVTVKDGYGGVLAVPVTVAVSPRNTAPAFGTPTVGAPDATTGVVTGSLSATDADRDTLTYSGSTKTTKGAVTVSATGTFSYTPTVGARDNAAATGATNADKQDTFTVTVNDAHGGTAALAVTVAVSPSKTPPPPPDTGTGHMAVGMNLENVVDWSPAWTFTDAFKASRPWISQAFNPQTWGLTWDETSAPTLDLDGNGNVKSLKTWTQNGVTMKQYASTLMFRGLGGDYAGGTYHAEWDGTGVVSFGFDAKVTSTGKTLEGRNFAELAVTPSDNGIYLRIEETRPTDPVRNINVWMPDYNGQSFRGQRWQPGASFSPFHPLFLARLDPFTTLRFMGMQETNSSDIVTWDQRRDANDIRQGSGSGGTPSEPTVNGMSLEYMVELANELDADPWFNMPYQADDTFVRNFATYVSQHLDPGRSVYVEWANEVWNFGWGFEASHWVADKARAAHLDPDYGQWIVAGQEAKRDLDIWSNVFAGQSSLHLVRVAAGWAAVDWVTNQIASNMGGSFDAIAFAPYITATDEQRARYTSATTVDQVLADTRTNVATSLQWTANHEALAQEWSTRLGRPIQLVTYEGGPHLDGRNAPYQDAFYAATNDSRMGDIYRDYLRGLDAAGLDLYLDFQFTGQAGATSWGDFAKLHRMDQSLATAYRYNAVVSAANGSLWNV